MRKWLASPTWRRRILQIGTYILIGVAASLIALGEGLSNIAVTRDLSVNMVLTAFIFLLAAFVMILQGNFLSTALVLLLVTSLIAGNVLAGNDLRHVQYALPMGVLLFTSMLRLSTADVRFLERTFLVASYAVVISLVLSAVGQFPWLTRASHTVLPIAGICILFLPAHGRLGHYWVRLFPVLVITAFAFGTTARMASLLLVVVIGVWLFVNRQVPAGLRTITGCGVLGVSVVFWLGNEWARERIFGRDASLSIGPVSVNAEGRTNAARIVNDQVLGQAGSTTGWLQVLFGHGGGTSGQSLVEAGFKLDKPHSEFLRVYTDGGVLLIWVLIIALVGTLTFLAWIRRLNSLRESAWAISALVFVTLLAFCLVDNALSYVWLLLPAGLLNAYARSPVEGESLESLTSLRA